LLSWVTLGDLPGLILLSALGNLPGFILLSTLGNLPSFILLGTLGDLPGFILLGALGDLPVSAVSVCSNRQCIVTTYQASSCSAASARGMATA
jgi:hypothetical protein